MNELLIKLLTAGYTFLPFETAIATHMYETYDCAFDFFSHDTRYYTKARAKTVMKFVQEERGQILDMAIVIEHVFDSHIAVNFRRNDALPRGGLTIGKLEIMSSYSSSVQMSKLSRYDDPATMQNYLAKLDDWIVQAKKEAKILA